MKKLRKKKMHKPRYFIFREHEKKLKLTKGDCKEKKKNIHLNSTNDNLITRISDSCLHLEHGNANPTRCSIQRQEVATKVGIQPTKLENFHLRYPLGRVARGNKDVLKKIFHSSDNLIKTTSC